jgi:four helix bundle protein
MPKSVEELDVFKMSHELALRVYSITRSFPKEETYSLTSQLRRAASSVPANLVEGANRSSRVDYRRFVSIAKGSAAETKYHLLLAKDLGYMQEKEYKQIVSDYARVLGMLDKLVKSL